MAWIIPDQKCLALIFENLQNIEKMVLNGSVAFFHAIGMPHGVFEYYSTRVLCAFLTGLVVTIGSGKWFIQWLYNLKIGEKTNREECPLLNALHQSKQDTPTMGGVLILFSLVFSLILWMDWTHSFTLLLLMTTLVIGGLGASDDLLKIKRKDKRGVRGKKKMYIQMLFALGVALYLLYPSIQGMFHIGDWFAPITAKDPFMENPIDPNMYARRLYFPGFKEAVWFMPTLCALALMVFVITGSSNAVNLTDGLDGLAAGTVLFASGALSMIAFLSNHLDWASYLHILYIEGSGEIAIYLAAVAGAAMGFLWYNSHPAQVFMGDTGSLTLGAILGVSAVLLRREFLFAWIGGVFVLEALSVIIQVAGYRWGNQRRIFLCAPLHHHFEYKGWPETKIVARFWILAMFLATLGVVTLKFQ